MFHYKLTRLVYIFILIVVQLALLDGCRTKNQPTGLESLPGVSIEYYDITGTSVDELRADLSIKHPVGYDNYKGDAATLWNIRWNWKGYGTDNCDLSTAEVTYSIRVILPRWEIPTNADSSLVRSWNEYRTCLVEHEKGHVRNVIDQYDRVREAIVGSSCDKADAAAHAALDIIRQSDAEYDKVTDHGATQGARFPREIF